MDDKNINQYRRMAIPELQGMHFFIPEYQRGYRWQERQIHQLLSDLNDFRINYTPGSNSFYCLQPIVVKKCSPETMQANNLDPSQSWYEIIDGQQRLTTLRLIFAFDQLMNPRARVRDPFVIKYSTRPLFGDIFCRLEGLFDDDGNLLDVMLPDEMMEHLDVDSYHVLQAMKHIIRWFKETGESFENRLTLDNYIYLTGMLKEAQDSTNPSIQVIWYELLDGTDAREMFNRLNNNKIELTNSELVRAMFLSESAKFQLENPDDFDDSELPTAQKLDKDRKQAHILEMWDIIEHKLREHNGNFWAFLTNRDRKTYANCIELIFDLISRKYLPANESEDLGNLKKDDTLFTFLYFDRIVRKGRYSLWQLWQEIEKCYAILVHWYETDSLYHKIGYLVMRLGDGIIPVLLSEAVSKPKDAFERDSLNRRISDQIDYDFDELDYQKNEDQPKIHAILDLYNVEIHRQSVSLGRFPFNLFKTIKWQLEHIHAVKSEGFGKTQSAWKAWIDENISLLNKFKLQYQDPKDRNLLAIERLIDKLADEKNNPKLSGDSVKALNTEIADFFDSLVRDEDKHMPEWINKLWNMTLLSPSLNIRVSNLVFEGKRQCVIETDAKGKEYLPIGSKRVYLKYHNKDEDDFDVQQLYFWGRRDQINYQKALISVLKLYL